MNTMRCPSCDKEMDKAPLGTEVTCPHCQVAFTRREVDLSKVKFGPYRDVTFSEEEQLILKVTFKIVGHYVARSFEEWEMGFTRDTDPHRELGSWARIAAAADKFHDRTGLPWGETLKDEEAVLAHLVAWSVGGDAEPIEGHEDIEMSDEHLVILRECFDNPLPDGFEGEEEAT